MMLLVQFLANKQVYRTIADFYFGSRQQNCALQHFKTEIKFHLKFTTSRQGHHLHEFYDMAQYHWFINQNHLILLRGRLTPLEQQSPRLRASSCSNLFWQY